MSSLIIQTTPSKKLGAHKMVLAARSPVFEAMFYGPCASGSDTTQIEDADIQTMNLFLRYFTNELNTTCFKTRTHLHLLIWYNVLLDQRK